MKHRGPSVTLVYPNALRSPVHVSIHQILRSKGLCTPSIPCKMTLKGIECQRYAQPGGNDHFPDAAVITTLCL